MVVQGRDGWVWMPASLSTKLQINFLKIGIIIVSTSECFFKDGMSIYLAFSNF